MSWLEQLLESSESIKDAVTRLVSGSTGEVLTVEQARQSTFFTATFSLLGKMAKADGVVTADEIAAIEAFMVELGCSTECRQVAIGIFGQAKRSQQSFKSMADEFAKAVEDAQQRRLVNEHFDDSTFGRSAYQLRLRMFELLYRLAMADKLLLPVEEKYLQQAKSAFGIPTYKYNEILGLPDPLGKQRHSRHYAILESTPDDSMAEIKKRYRQLLHENHPDKLVSQGLPPEFIKLANQRIQVIVEAYDTLEKERGSQ